MSLLSALPTQLLGIATECGGEGRQERDCYMDLRLLGDGDLFMLFYGTGDLGLVLHTSVWGSQSVLVKA